MKTDDLIAALAADTLPQTSVLGQLGRSLPLGLTISVAAFALVCGTRADLATALGSAVVLKTLVPLVLALVAGALAVALARPLGAVQVRFAALGLMGAAALVAFALALWRGGGAALADALATPSRGVCLVSIPVLAVPLLFAAFRALAAGATLRPRWTGAAAGLLAGGVAASVYSLYCDQDTALFVLPAYGAAIASVGIIGAVAGPRLLRW